MQGVRQDVHAKAQHSRYALWFVAMQIQLRAIVHGESTSREDQDKMLRDVWQRISVQESQRHDLWAFVWEQARMDPSALDFANRVDRLRGLGNLVVPLQGAVAFTLLMRRLNCGS
jgi:hypothetical protein